MLGEIPGGNLRAYYKLENVNDSSGRGYNLTNNNSVSIPVSGKFSGGADFGSSGTNQSLSYTGNIMSSATGFEFEVSCWFKLNTIVSSNTDAVFVFVATGSRNSRLYYNISGSNITVSIRRGGVGPVSVTFAADTEWHHVHASTDSGATPFHRIEVDRQYINTGTGGNTGASAAQTRIGNDASVASEPWAIIDEVFIGENRFYDANLGNRMRYYTQAKGRFCI